MEAGWLPGEPERRLGYKGGEVLTQVICPVSETAPGEVSGEQLRGTELPLST